VARRATPTTMTTSRTSLTPFEHASLSWKMPVFGFRAAGAALLGISASSAAASFTEP